MSYFLAAILPVVKKTPEQVHQEQGELIDRALGITWSMVGVSVLYAVLAIIIVILLMGPVGQSIGIDDNNDSF